MWPIILLLGAFSAHYITATELQRGNYLVNVDDGVLRSIKSTGDSLDIDLSDLKIKKIEENVFDSLSSVKSLNLGKNKLENLPPSIFSKLTQLETLSLAENEISQLADKNFIGLEKLKTFNISKNSLSRLQKGVFYGLKPSVDIITEGNDLYSISTEIFVNPDIQEPITDEDEISFQNNVPEVQTTTEIPPVLDANVQVKICKKTDGMQWIVKSVEELKKDEALVDDCVKAVVDHELRELDLSGLSLRKFEKGWYKLSALPFASISLRKNDITEISSELLNDLPAGLTFVNLGSNKIEIIKKNVIENQHLKTLNLVDNFISTIEDGALEKTKLTNIGVSTNRLTSLSFARTLPSTLQVLTANDNAIVDIPEDSMKNLKELLYINLSHNNVTNLPANTLRGVKKVQAIHLTYNQLSEIHPGTFEDQEKLVDLHLHFNRIANIKSGSFRGLKIVESIFLTSNKIKKLSPGCFPDSKESIGYTLYLDGNEIETIEKGSFAGAAVKDLHLEQNRISTIPDGAFDTPTLNRLNLGENLFTMIGENSFAGLPNLSQLNLKMNKISNIKKGAVKNLKKLVTLDISNNPIERLENGALYGFRTQRGASVTAYDTFIKVIQGGAFENL